MRGKRGEALDKYKAHRITIEAAAEMAGLSVQQFKKLCLDNDVRLMSGPPRAFDHHAAREMYHRIRSYSKVGLAFGVSSIAVFKAVKRIDRSVTAERIASAATTAIIALVILVACSMPSHAARRGCDVDRSVMSSVAEIRRVAGSLRITSTCGGRHARHSYHYRRRAVDFRASNVRAVNAWLIAHHHGGWKHYGGGLFHIDSGPGRASGRRW